MFWNIRGVNFKGETAFDKNRDILLTAVVTIEAGNRGCCNVAWFLYS